MLQAMTFPYTLSRSNATEVMKQGRINQTSGLVTPFSSLIQVIQDDSRKVIIWKFPKNF